jgi:hypothetical protein
MPDEDRETQYYDLVTRKVKWRCKYCLRTFKLSGGTSIITDHLIWAEAEEGYNIPYLSSQEI